MILGESALWAWLVDGSGAGIVDEFISGSTVAAPDIINVLSRARVPFGEAEGVINDLIALGLEVEGIGLTHVLALSEATLGGASQRSGTADLFAIALGRLRHEQVMRICDDGVVIDDFALADSSRGHS